MIAIAPLLVGAGINLGSKLLGGMFGKKKKASRDPMEAAAADEMARSGRYEAQANESRTRYLSQLDSYDPGAYAREQAGAITDEFGEDYANAEAGRRTGLARRGFYGGSVGRGMLNKQLSTRLARDLSGLAMQTAQMKQGQIDRYGNVYEGDRQAGMYSHGQYLDLLAGNRDAQIDKRNATWGGVTGVLGAGLNAAATYYGKK